MHLTAAGQRAAEQVLDAARQMFLKAVFDVSVTGDDVAVALEEREVIKELQADDDGPRIIRKYAAFAARAQARVAPISLLARHAAAAEPDAAEVWQQIALGGAPLAEEQTRALVTKGYRLPWHAFDVLVLKQFVRQTADWRLT